MFAHHLPHNSTDDYGHIWVNDSLDYTDLSNRTKGYSGADIQLICKEAAMSPLRKIFDLLDKESLEQTPEGYQSSIIFLIHSVATLREPVQHEDVIQAIEKTKPSSSLLLNERYVEWQKQHGST